VDTVRARADYVAAARGGSGAVREVCELLLAARSA
jgi:3-deoxy-D-manno-octulosonate 8-phosphate phosphatase KdsC-like HAD superfamily phosphatase